jgi:hypothetical protein
MAQVKGLFIPSTQRYYRRIILLLLLLHVSVVRPSSSSNILLATITQLTTDPLFLEYSYHLVIGLITGCLVDARLLLWVKFLF